MFRALAPYVPPALTAAILGTVVIQEVDHLAPESVRTHLKPLLGRRREPPADFAGDAAPQIGVFAGNNRPCSAVLVVQAGRYADRQQVARTAAKSCVQWNSKDIDMSLGFSPRIWDAVKGHVPLGTLPSNSLDFKLKDRFAEKSRKSISNSGGDLLVHVKASSHGECAEVVRSVLKDLEGLNISWSEDIYGFREEHPSNAVCPVTNRWTASSDTLCQIACVPNVGSSYALVQRWEDDPLPMKLKAKPLPNHSERITGMDQDGMKLQIVKNTTRTGRFGTRSGEDKPGMLFVAYSANPKVFDYMLDRIVGKRGGSEDTLLQSNKCIRSQQFYIPSQAQLNALANSH